MMATEETGFDPEPDETQADVQEPDEAQAEVPEPAAEPEPAEPAEVPADAEVPAEPVPAEAVPGPPALPEPGYLTDLRQSAPGPLLAFVEDTYRRLLNLERQTHAHEG